MSLGLVGTAAIHAHDERALPASQSDSTREVNTPAKVWAAAAVPNETTTGGLTFAAKVFTATGAVKPGDDFPMVLEYSAGAAAVPAATVKVVLNAAALYSSAKPAPVSGTGTSASPLTFTIAGVPANGSGTILVNLKAKSLTQDPEVMWKDISSNVTLEVPGQSAVALRTHGPKVTTLASARYGDRPFPVVMVEYQDIKHCSGSGTRSNGAAATECTSDHTAVRMDEAVNSKTSGKSLYQLYQDMSLGQIFPIGRVSPAPNTPNTAVKATDKLKFSVLAPAGTCTGQTLSNPVDGSASPAYTTRVSGGWYQLPGTQAYYGADKTGHALAGSVSGQALLFDIDSACGPTGKIVYDAAALADPDIDYNVFDTDRDGVVDFFNLMFAGDGGNGNTTASGLNNVWPHKSDLRFYFTDTVGQTGYVSNDQLKNLSGEPQFYKDATRKDFSSTSTSFPVFVRVGPYNVNPESAVDKVSVVAHEYGHSLSLPDFYSTGSRTTYGSWELMAADHFQYMTGYSRQKLGWIVPKTVASGVTKLTESKTDTNKIEWKRPDGTPYTLTGADVHNADVYRMPLPTVKLITAVPSGVRAWHSGSGNDFGCPPEAGHNLDIYVPELEQPTYKNAASIKLTFKSNYEMEWDFDYGFVLVSADGGKTWTSVASAKNTTIANTYNPNSNGCMTKYNNGITGSSGSGSNTVANTDRLTSAYTAPKFIDDEFDLSAFKGKQLIIRLAYSTDPGLSKRGWFVDDIKVTADGKTVYESDFEKSQETERLQPFKWARVSTADGVDSDHAYYFELRDRINNDFDSKTQSDRGVPTWQPGISMILTDENHGFGNTGVDDPPAQTPVDAVPAPGSATPDLNDASYNLTRASFNGCTHIDNYTDPAGPNKQFKVPNQFKFAVTGITGLATNGVAPMTPATATLTTEVYPDCNLLIAPPVLSIASGYENPDSNGAYNLSWTRPVGAVGPDTLQEATVLQALLSDDAEGLSKWDTSTEGQGAFAWTTSTAKKHGGSNAFWGRYQEGSDTQGAVTGNKPATLLTLKTAIAIPAQGETTLSYWDFFVNEGDDSVNVEASTDGVKWQTINQSARSAGANDAALALAQEPMTLRVFPLNEYKGKSIKLRYRLASGGDNRATSTSIGWYVDDIKVETSNFKDFRSSATTMTEAVTGHAGGTYYYRVLTRYPAGPVTIESAYSNVVTVTVKDGVVGAPNNGNPVNTANPGSPTNPANPSTPIVGAAPVSGSSAAASAGSGRFGGAPGAGLLALLAAGAMLRRRRMH